MFSYIVGNLVPELLVVAFVGNPVPELLDIDLVGNPVPELLDIDAVGNSAPDRMSAWRYLVSELPRTCRRQPEMMLSSAQ